jgi:NAD(P)-dependent dehydrogenase (short-subunit alcohol dehydrogenase family)
VARVLVTGSSTGLGLLAAQLLTSEDHQVVLHARSEDRANDARIACPLAAGLVIGDLSTLDGMHDAAEGANALGPFDAVIHNAAVAGDKRSHRTLTADGLCHVFAVNVLAPYVLTALVETPGRLVYTSSALHRTGSPNLDDLQWQRRRWDGLQAYSDSKLFDAVLAFAIARHWPHVLSNVVEPGWVATRMGGPDAPDDLSLGPITQAWLAVSDDDAAHVSGRYWFHQSILEPSSAVLDQYLQDNLLATCAGLSRVNLP